jgi:hypothetical protein
MLALLLAASLVAHADPPKVDVEDGAVVGRILVPATAADVRRVVDDPVACGELSPDVMSVKSHPDEAGAHPDAGHCYDVVTETRGLFGPLHYRSRRCATKDGWEDHLMESSDFKAYDSRWSLREVDGQTEVTLSVNAQVDLPVPQSVIETHSKKSVGTILENLLHQLLH